MKKILVTGGCGYIGSHTIVDLVESGFEIISIDNHINSNPRILENIKSITNKEIKNYNIDLCDKQKTRNVFIENPDIIGIIHFASLKSIPESIDNPLLYYSNNLVSLMNILEMVDEFSIKNFIFSSSCSVYGEVDKSSVDEETPMGETLNPYSTSKKMCENIIKDFFKTKKDENSIILRYFNPGGSHESGLLGEEITDKSSNLISVILKGVKNGESITIYGNDYPTRDGSCVRDYIHIQDLAEAHTKSLRYSIENSNKFEIFNLGTGVGTTVLEAIESMEKESGLKVRYKIVERREGDIASIYSDYYKAKLILNWSPKRDISDIMRTTLKWNNI